MKQWRKLPACDSWLIASWKLTPQVDLRFGLKLGHVAMAAEHRGDQGGPAGLVAGAESFAAVGVKVLVEQNQIFPAGIITVSRTRRREPAERRSCRPRTAKSSVVPSSRATSISVMHVAASGRTFDLEIIAIENVIPLERLDQQEIGGKPDRSAPVAVAAEHAAFAFARHVVDFVMLTAKLELERLDRDARPTCCGFRTATGTRSHPASPQSICGIDPPTESPTAGDLRYLNSGSSRSMYVMCWLRSSRLSKNHFMRRLNPGNFSMISSSRITPVISGSRPDQRPHADRNRLAVDKQVVVVKSVRFVPQPAAVHRVHGFGNRDVMLEELAGHVAVGLIVLGQFDRHPQHRAAVKRHP